MQRAHITFILTECYGHIVPTLGIALELMKRGYDVSYAVPREFAVEIEKTGAKAMVYDISDVQAKWFPEIQKIQEYKGHDKDLLGKDVVKKCSQERFHILLPQLRDIYRCNRPNLIIYDLCIQAGKSFADMQGIPRIEHSPMVIDNRGRENILGGVYDEELVMISLPRMFQRGADLLDHRFRFTGFCAEGRELFFNTWTGNRSREKTILVAGQSDGITQLQHFDVVVRALRDFSGRVVLSAGPTCISSLGSLPGNFEVNPHCSNFSILRQCSLYIGQGGQGSTLEALYSGVPVILIPPNTCDHTFIGRVIELGLGFRLEPSEASAEAIRCLVSLLLRDNDMLQRVKAVQKHMQAQNGSECAVDLIENLMWHIK